MRCAMCIASEDWDDLAFNSNHLFDELKEGTEKSIWAGFLKSSEPPTTLKQDAHRPSPCPSWLGFRGRRRVAIGRSILFGYHRANRHGM